MTEFPLREGDTVRSLPSQDSLTSPKDYVQAYAWNNIAAAQGNETAKENLEIITKKMSTAGITKAQELSREYWEAYGPNRTSSE